MSYTNRLSMDYRRLVSKLMPSRKRDAEVKKFGYKVHGHPFSTNTRRVLAVLLEKGLLYEPITVDLKSGDHKKEAFLSLNPFGQVPVFEDENANFKFEISPYIESRAITQYIAYLHSARGTQLLSLESEETLATLTMWMEIEAHQFDPFASKLTWEQVIKPIYGLETDHTVVKESEAGLEKVLNVYEKRLEESRFLACNNFTLVDLHHLPNIQYLLETTTKRLLENRPRVRMWVDEITGREAWKMACDQEMSWFGKQRKDGITGKALKMPCEQAKSWFACAVAKLSFCRLLTANASYKICLCAGLCILHLRQSNNPTFFPLFLALNLMAGIRLPPEEPETTPQQQTRATATDSLAYDDDQSIAADSWSIKSEYGSTLDDDQHHADAAEALSSANLRVSSDYSSDKEEPDADGGQSMLGLQSYWDAAYSDELSNFREHGHTGEVWFGDDVMEIVTSWTKDLYVNKSLLI
ncbi:hypothetical protein Bca52824_034728 [Brassica carinata]|uniref:glutathione transferase n=1 Tax=Brassica carinata TaxID=52824 RepID=A0A8X7S2C7_BRACI|nr:hypothetical protein Bca52824_034728 [Brassica carinata]